MIEIKNIIQYIIKQKVSSIKSESDYYIINENIFIEQKMILSFFNKIKQLESKNKTYFNNKLFIYIDPISSGILNWGWYIKLIQFLYQNQITPILIFNHICINRDFYNELLKLTEATPFIIDFILTNNKEEFIFEKNNLIKKYDSNKFLLSSYDQLIYEENWENYYYLFHDDFLDQYDTSWFHYNKIKKELFQSRLSFFILCTETLLKYKIPLLITNYLDLISDKFNINLIKPDIEYPDYYVAKENKYVVSHLNQSASIEHLNELSSILNYQIIPCENLENDVKFKYFQINKIFTDFKQDIDNFPNMLVFLFDDNASYEKALIPNIDNIYDNLEIIINYLYPENVNENPISYQLINEVIFNV